jgi:DNA-binding response OmpR family regulator
MAQVLLVEDDPAIRRSLTRALIETGHAVTSWSKGADAVRELVTRPPDVVLLDLGLPDLDGADVLAMIRAVSQVPVIVVTARDADTEAVRLLDRGADDYLVKPFAVAQLTARIRAVLRRAGTPASADEKPLEVGGLVIDRMARQVTLDGRRIELSRKEFDLLLTLARRAGEVVTKRELLTEVWQQPLGGADRTVDVHLSWLRRKLGETAAEPHYLHSVRGVGVRLAAPGEG